MGLYIPVPTAMALSYNNGDASSYSVTLSPHPAGTVSTDGWRDGVIVAFIVSSHGTLTAPNSTPSGIGLTWTKWIDQVQVTDVRRLEAWTAPVTQDVTTGTVTITHTGNTPSTGTSWFFLGFRRVDPVAPVAHTASTAVNSTSISTALPRLLSVANRWFTSVHHRANEGTTPRTGWTEPAGWDLTGNSPVHGHETHYLFGGSVSGAYDNTASASWVTSGHSAIGNLEIRAIEDRSRGRLNRRRR